jgi:hypothetical protein
LLKGTIKNRLSEGHYDRNSEFERDVRLVFANALQYNNDGDEVWCAADGLMQVFDSIWGNVTNTTTPATNAETSSLRVDTAEDEPRIRRTPTARKPAKRRSGLSSQSKASMLGDVIVDIPHQATSVAERVEEIVKNDASARDYTKLVRDGGWKAGALEVMIGTNLELLTLTLTNGTGDADAYEE